MIPLRGWIVPLFAACLLIVLSGRGHSRDDGRYAGSPLKPWFDGLKSGKGLCCSDADGSALSDSDWETKDGHYRVRVPRSTIPGGLTGMNGSKTHCAGIRADGNRLYRRQPRDLRVDFRQLIGS